MSTVGLGQHPFPLHFIFTVLTTPNTFQVETNRVSSMDLPNTFQVESQRIFLSHQN